MQVEWLTRNEAADRLKLGLRRTLDLAHNGTLKTTKVRDPFTHQMTVRFNAGDIERYLNQRQSPTQAAPQLESARDAVLAELRPSPEAAAELQQMPTKTVLREPRGIDPAYLAVFARELQRKAETDLYKWLTIDQAASYTQLSAELLLDLIRGAKLPALRVRGTREKRRAIDCYRVKRADLDALAGERHGAQAQ